MTDAQKAFVAYLLEVFDERFDDSDIRHITYLAIFEAGFEAGEDNERI